jgi:hypothetical protein
MSCDAFESSPTLAVARVPQRPVPVIAALVRELVQVCSGYAGFLPLPTTGCTGLIGFADSPEGE